MKKDEMLIIALMVILLALNIFSLYKKSNESYKHEIEPTPAVVVRSGG